MVSVVSKGLERGLFCLIIIVGFIYTSEAIGYNCYQCLAAEKTDSCAVNVTTQPTTYCGTVGTKCVTERKTDAYGHFQSLTRSCHLEVEALGAKSKCSTNSKGTTCQVICSDNLCNDLSEDQVEAAAVKVQTSTNPSILGGYNCYTCETHIKGDSCAVDAAFQPKAACGIAGTKCTIVRESETSGRFLSISRQCSLEEKWLGAKSTCSTKGNKKTCQVICTDELCNDLSEEKVDACAESDCKGGATVSGIKLSLLAILRGVTLKLTIY